MWTRFFGALLFVWMVAAVIAASKSMHAGGTPMYTELAAIVVCSALGLIGLAIALGIGKGKPKGPA